ncbi:MAG TPA: acyltransferase [Acetobacteraceae bacterium]|nr:acyltransferase [Acetobacteraceae bacterium]
MLRQGEIKSLTGLRGVAACWVVVFHYANLGPNITGSVGPELAKTLVRHGYLAVDLFFVLSGFVMALTYGSAFKAGFSTHAFLEFLGKRLGRVYPLYIAITLIMAGLAYAGLSTRAPPSLLGLTSNVLLIQAWGIAASVDGPAWSISTEFAAYLLFPLLVRMVLVGHWARSWAAAATATAILVVVATRTTVELHQIVGGIVVRAGPLDVSRFATAYPLLRCLAGFTLGLFAFRLAQAGAVRRFLAMPFAGDLGLIAVLTLMAVPGSDVLLVLLFVPLVIALAAEQSFIAKKLASGILYWLGLVSYSIYLTHWFAQELFRSSFRASLEALHVPHAFPISGVLTIAPMLVLSALTYYGIEKPGRDWVRKLLRSRSTLPVGSEPAAP